MSMSISMSSQQALLESPHSIFCSTSDFKFSQDIMNEHGQMDVSLFSSPPFSFYKSEAASHKSNKFKASSHSFFSSKSKSNKQQDGSGGSGPNTRTCWLRLTRLNQDLTPPKITSQAVHDYLQDYRRKVATHPKSSSSTSSSSSPLAQFLTLETLAQSPPPPPPSQTSMIHKTEIKSFLRQYKKYLKRQRVQQTLQPIYNQLFEWLQQQQNSVSEEEELVWGFGNAKMMLSDSACDVLNGPLLEVRIEMELAPDGALLLRPRPHTGVTLNRKVVMALSNHHSTQNYVETASTLSSSSSRWAASTSASVTSTSSYTNLDKVLSNLYRSVSEMETNQFSPGEPNTYINLLKRMAVELSSGGVFQSISQNHSSKHNISSNLVVSDAWCVYARVKPKSTWAKDASALEHGILSLQHHQDYDLSNIQSNLPLASWVFTHGPGALDALLENKRQKQDTNILSKNLYQHGYHLFLSLKSSLFKEHPPQTQPQPQPPTHTPPNQRPLFPLPTSEAQNRIAELLLTQHYPAIVCEGPPGTGKTHTIANILCAYLSFGKRVLITSKGPSALSVLRQRLPKPLQELCVVDVSSSELHGMRQLQQTVERLANRISNHVEDVEVINEKVQFLQEQQISLEQELQTINETLQEHSERKRHIFSNQTGIHFAKLSCRLWNEVPYLMKSTSCLTIHEMNALVERANLFVLDPNDSIRDVSVHITPTDNADVAAPPSDGLISQVAANAGKTFSLLKTTSFKTMASLPLLGALSGLSQSQAQWNNELNTIRINDKIPETPEDWKIVLRSLEYDRDLYFFHQETLYDFITQHKCPTSAIYENRKQTQNPSEASIFSSKHCRRFLKKTFVEYLKEIAQVKEMSYSMNLSQEIQYSKESSELDTRRSQITARLQKLASDLVEIKVIMELKNMFSAEAQSALIRFSQVAGKARFSKSSSSSSSAAASSKLTQRQKRHRQEYLDAFEKCVRYIPCWILTSSQISDYLPSELGLFDLVVIDEASQSDITVLPAMLRGKQWLVVGDGKQVSPTESFVSEAQINALKVALPESPFEHSFLPGQSFFDFCAQAFPKGRVVLKEHFRCAPEIIQFSNVQFYDAQLTPLRLPTPYERMIPSLMDVRVPNGRKVGKINQEESNVIVSMIEELIAENTASRSHKPRSIGVISLVGNDQSKLIRGRVLNAIGPQKYKEHDILVGDPPTFQGAERDVIFLSMVCSPGNVPTQNQLMHVQRVNVALSRARDRMVLVRSIDCNHVPNNEDIKISILEFFDQAKHGEKDNSDDDSKEMESQYEEKLSRPGDSIFHLRTELEQIVEEELKRNGFVVRRMGVVWNDAIVIENETSGLRAAVCLVCAGESKQEWSRTLTQQKSIERVGWNCLRVDTLLMLLDFSKSFQSILDFLASFNVEPSFEPNVIKSNEDTTIDPSAMEIQEEETDAGTDVEVLSGPNNDNDSVSVLVIISDDECSRSKGPKQVHVKEEKINYSDDYAPEKFGDIADQTFLVNHNTHESTMATEKSDEFLDNVADPPYVVHNNETKSMMETDKTGDQSTVPSDPPTNQIQFRSEHTFSKSESNGIAHLEDTELPTKVHRKRTQIPDEAYLGDDSEEEFSSSDTLSLNTSSSKRRRRLRRRLDKYSRDGRWYPKKNQDDTLEAENNWYDTDSDLCDTAPNHENLKEEEV